MRLLLDTHALAWWYLDHPLPHPVQVIVEDPDNVVFASAISAYEAGYETGSANGRTYGLLAAFDEIVKAQRLSLLPDHRRACVPGGIL